MSKLVEVGERLIQRKRDWESSHGYCPSIGLRDSGSRLRPGWLERASEACKAAAAR